jgi:FkbH-like protein
MHDETSPAQRFTELRARLAAPGLTPARIFSIGSALLETAWEKDEGLTIQRVTVIGSLTTDFIGRAVAAGLALEGVAPVLYAAPFGALFQEALDPHSGLHRFAPELVLIAADWRDGVSPLPIGASPAETEAALTARAALFERVWEALEGGGTVRLIQHLLPPPPLRFLGPAERLAPASPLSQIEALNRALLARGRGRVSWLELDRLAMEAGLSRFLDPAAYHAARLGFETRFLPDYLTHFRAAWRAAHARARKALVLDLDDTLWGGVIGDDGVEGMVLGPPSPRGEAFAAWQAYLKELASRGVVLAVCSKNDPALAAQGFTHPASVLRREDFAVFHCSWESKAEGIRRVARELDLGLDALVFADDNPAECELVSRALPEVAVLHLGEDPARFIEKLDRERFFHLDSYTPEDFARTQSYSARAAAAEAEKAAPDLASYLAGLEMRGFLFRPALTDLPRLAQLERKTNQFNLTTRRFSETEIRAFLENEAVVVLALRLADKFGDHGLVSSLIAVPDGPDLVIESWLMSCRVFSRTAEAFMLRHLLGLAAERGAARLVGLYRPTPKNGVVADLYPRLGFAPSGETGRFIRTVGDTSDLLTYVSAV